MSEQNLSTEQDFHPMSIADQSVVDVLKQLPDEALQSFSFPLFSNTASKPQKDADGFIDIDQDNLWNLHKMQKTCREKAEANPQLNSHIRDFKGRLTGWGFEFNSGYPDIQKAIEEVMEDPRNDLYQKFPKFVARDEMEGELFLMYTLHKDGFVEVDFISPDMISGGGDKGSGIIFHPRKQSFPLFYVVNFENNKKDSGSAFTKKLIPSINVGYYPDLENEVKDHGSYDSKKLDESRYSSPKGTPYAKSGGFYRFMVHWNKGHMVKRNVSHIRSTIEWTNYYEDLKKYEIDHKKSSGAYLWVITMDDIQAFRRWLEMTEEDRKATGIKQPKEPGGTLILPPGLNLTVENPKLPTISDEDTDIMQMISSGLQKPQDTMLGDYRSTYASVKASQGPQGDRVNDQLHYFKLFLMYDFWRPILWLRSLARNDFKYERRVEEVVDFKNQEPVKKKIVKPVWKLVDVCLPVSRLEDVEAIAKGLLGSKHASVVDTLGIPRQEIAKRLGFNNYRTLRMTKAIEDEEYPETLSVDNEEAAQEKQEAEPDSSQEKGKSEEPDEDDSKSKKSTRRQKK